MRGGSTQALPMAPPPATAQQRGRDHQPHPHPHCVLLDRMAPLLRPPAATAAAAADGGPQLTRLLVNVTVERSLWPVHVVLPADATVADLVRAAAAAYAREGRRPPLPPVAGGADALELHLSQYSLERLRPEAKVLDLASRNFFLCAPRPRPPAAA
ncbi:hypothetical protein ACP4OV_017187 [Aristida adscensionis]